MRLACRESRVAISFLPSVLNTFTTRSSWSVFLATYRPFFCFLSADRPRVITILVPRPNSLAALGSVIPFLILEMTCPIESQVSRFFGESEKYCLAVLGFLKGSAFPLFRRAMRLYHFR